MNQKKSVIKELFKITSIIITLALIIKLSYELKWLDVLLGIYKLESKPDSVQSISLKTMAFIAKTGNEMAFLQHMEANDWKFVRYYGRGMLFDKSGFELLITKNTFFGKYAFYEVTSKSLFEMV